MAPARSSDWPFCSASRCPSVWYVSTSERRRNEVTKRISVWIACWVCLSNLASFFSISLLRSQFGLFGAIFKRSCACMLNRTKISVESRTHQVLGSFCLVLGYDLLRQPLDIMFDSVFRLCGGFMLAQCARLGVKVSIRQDGLNSIPTKRATSIRVTEKNRNILDAFDFLTSSFSS